MNVIGTATNLSAGLDALIKTCDQYVMRGCADLCALFNRYVKKESGQAPSILQNFSRLIGAAAPFLEISCLVENGVGCLHETVSLINERDFIGMYQFKGPTLAHKISQLVHDGILFFQGDGKTSFIFRGVTSLSWAVSIGTRLWELYHLAGLVHKMKEELKIVNRALQEEKKIQDILFSGEFQQKKEEKRLKQDTIRIAEIICDYKAILARESELPASISSFERLKTYQAEQLGEDRNLSAGRVADEQLFQEEDFKLRAYLEPIKAHLKATCKGADPLFSVGGLIAIAQVVSRVACLILFAVGLNMSSTIFLVTNVAETVSTLSLNIFRNLREQELVGPCMLDIPSGIGMWPF